MTVGTSPSSGSTAVAIRRKLEVSRADDGQPALKVVHDAAGWLLQSEVTQTKAGGYEQKERTRTRRVSAPVSTKRALQLASSVCARGLIAFQKMLVPLVCPSGCVQPLTLSFLKTKFISIHLISRVHRSYRIRVCYQPYLFRGISFNGTVPVGASLSIDHN